MKDKKREYKREILDLHHLPHGKQPKTVENTHTTAERLLDSPTYLHTE